MYKEEVDNGSDPVPASQDNFQGSWFLILKPSQSKNDCGNQLPFSVKNTLANP